MPNTSSDEFQQYWERIDKLAQDIMALAQKEKRSSRHVWFFGNIAASLRVSEDDVRVACHTPIFTAAYHVQHESFFRKSE